MDAVDPVADLVLVDGVHLVDERLDVDVVDHGLQAFLGGVLVDRAQQEVDALAEDVDPPLVDGVLLVLL